MTCRMGWRRAPGRGHLRRVETGPLAVDDAAERLEPMRSTAASEASTSQAAAPSVICELLPGVTLPYFFCRRRV